MRVALLIVGSAILLFSCDSKSQAEVRKADPTVMTEYSENLSIVMSQNGRRSYFFETPLLEGYTLGAEPYREFREGIKITTYQDDSLTTVNAVLTANYAIYYEQRELWEAKGNVEVHKFDGTEVYTQQLFWNARTKQIYSNVDTKLVRGNNVTVGERFESDEEFRDWRFRYQKSRMEVEMKPESRDGDTTQQAETPARAEERTVAPRQQERTPSGPAPMEAELQAAEPLPLQLQVDERHAVPKQDSREQKRPRNTVKRPHLPIDHELKLQPAPMP